MDRRLPVPERWLLPPAPEGAAGRRWALLPFEERRRLAGCLTATPGDCEAPDGLLVALARRRLDTAWRLRAVAVVLGWLVLMTVWGYGRARTGQAAGPWLVAGLGLGALAAVVHWRATSDRLARVRRHLPRDARRSP